MTDEIKTPVRRRDPLGIGFGVFLVVAGALSLAEHAGLIPALNWGAPIFWMVVGGVVIYNSVSKK